MKKTFFFAMLVTYCSPHIQAKQNTFNNFAIRPWGRFDILLDENYCKVKKITVLPGKRLSYQQHQFREEHWIIVQGDATVTIDGNTNSYGPGSMIHIPIKTKHRIGNNSQEPLIFIETQLGTYFGEDDIERFEDDYGRV